MGRGRPSKYNDQVAPRIDEIHEWAKAGATNAEIAAALGVHVGTFNEYLTKYPDLHDSVKTGRMAGVPEVRMALFKRAVGFDVQDTETEMAPGPDGGKPVPVKVKVIKRHVPPDINAIQMYLRNAADEWRDMDSTTQAVKEAEAELKKAMAAMQGF